jgi:hypothetical protein
MLPTKFTRSLKVKVHCRAIFCRCVSDDLIGNRKLKRKSTDAIYEENKAENC